MGRLKTRQVALARSRVSGRASTTQRALQPQAIARRDSLSDASPSLPRKWDPRSRAVVVRRKVTQTRVPASVRISLKADRTPRKGLDRGNRGDVKLRQHREEIQLIT